MPTADASTDRPFIRSATFPAALALFWLCFIAAYTVRGALLGYDHPWQAFERRCLVALVGVALSALMYAVLSRSPGRTLASGIACTVVMSIPAAAVFSTCSQLMFSVVAPLPGESCATGLPCTLQAFLFEVSDMMINWTFVFAAWGLLCLSLSAAAAQRDALVASSRYREAARLAEIRALRYQVNPHFFFNVLNSLQGLVNQNRREEAESLIGELARLFRATLAADPLAESTLEDEIDLQQRYIAIELRRFPGRLALDVQLDPAAAQARVPALILQPLVENSIKHGVAHSSALVTIRIRAQMAAGMLQLSVADDARRELPPSAAGLGIGLQNVGERLALHYGEQAQCRASSRGPGFITELSLPLTRAA